MYKQNVTYQVDLASFLGSGPKLITARGLQLNKALKASLC